MARRSSVAAAAATVISLLGDLRLGLEARDVPMGAQTGDPIGLEAMAAGGRPPLAIENAGDHRVGIEGRQPAHEVQGLFIGSNGCGPRARQRRVDIGQRAALPAQCEVGRRLVTVNREDHFLDERRKSSLRSRGVVVGASQTMARSAPRASRRSRSSWPRTRGRCSRRRASSSFAASRSVRRCSHSRSSPRATSRLSGRPPCNDARRGWLHSSRVRRPAAIA